MIHLLLDTNVLIHLLNPTGNAEAGLTRQLLDWDRAGRIRLSVSEASGQEQGRTVEQLATEVETLGLDFERIISVYQPSDMNGSLQQISQVLNQRKQGDQYDALIVYTALAWAQQEHDTLLVTGDRNILRHAEPLQALGVPPIVTLRGVVNRLKVKFPLTILRHDHLEGLTT